MPRNDYLEVLANFPLSRSGDRAPRVALAVGATVTDLRTQTTVNGQSVNVSRTGALIDIGHATWPDLRTGLRVRVALEPDGHYIQSPVSLTADIIRIIGGEGTATRIGLRFNGVARTSA